MFIFGDCVVTISNEFPVQCPYDGIYIYLIPRMWNDFGFNISYFINIFIDKKKYDLGNVKIYCKDFENIDEYVMRENRLPENSYSLGQSKSYYETLASLNENTRVKIYTALHDICFNKKLYNDIIDEDVFRSALARFISLDDITDDFMPLASGGYSNGYLGFAYRFPREFNCAEAMNFKVDLSNSINNVFAIVGANGVGKTTFFKDLLSCIYNIPTNAQISQNFSEKKRMFNNVIHISYTGFDDEKFNFLYNQIELKKNEKNYPLFYHFNLNDNFDDDSLKLMLMGIISNIEKSKLFNEIFVLYQKDYYFNCPCFIYTGNYIEKQLKYNETKDESTLVVAKDYYHKIFKSYSAMSSGQKFIFRTTIQLVSNLSPNSLILIDEPENHLHPPLLSMYINALSKIAEFSNSLLIAATHSPVVLQEILSKNVYCLMRRDDITSFYNPTVQTYGASYQEIVFDIFRCEVVNTGFYSKLNQLVEKYQNFSKIMDALDNQLGSYGQGLLKLMCDQYEKNRKTKNRL